MNLFGAILEGPILLPLPELGAEIKVSAVDSTTNQFAPIVGVGADVIVSSAVNSRSEALTVAVDCGVSINIAGPIAGVSDALAPTVATSAHITVNAAVDAVSLAVAPTITTGVDVHPSTSDATAIPVIPTVGAGVKVVLANSVDTTGIANAPALAAGTIIVVDAAIDTQTSALAPALIGGGTSIFPIVATVVTESFDIGGTLEGAVLEFATLGGNASTHNFVINFSSFSAVFPPTLATGKNVIVLASVDNLGMPQIPDIETERRRRMVQAIAA